jgi:hypothetical protein
MHKLGFGLFGVFFAVIAALVLVSFVAAVFLSYQCYSGGDPNNIACYMISDRHEIGIRNR